VKLIDAAETERQLPFATLIPALRDMFVTGCVVPPRHQHRIAPDLAAAVRAADIVSCATFATDPLVLGAWLQPGVHLDLIGSFTPQMRETEDAAIGRSSIFVDTDHALKESGDLLLPMRNGVFSADRLAGTLADLCTGRHRGRVTTEEVTLFKAVATSMSDLAAAMVMWRGQDRAGSAHA
jgi:ornithine cyclodeaminase